MKVHNDFFPWVDFFVSAQFKKMGENYEKSSLKIMVHQLIVGVHVQW